MKTIQVPDRIFQRIQKASKQTGYDVKVIINAALSVYCEFIEDGKLVAIGLDEDE